MHPFALACTAVLGLLLFGLGLIVSLARGKYDLLFGYPDAPTHAMQKWVRAHGNTAEYAPFLAILILYLGTQQPAAWVLWTMGIATASRVLIVVGLTTCATLAKPHPIRFVGALGTYVTGLALTAALLVNLTNG